MMELAVSVLSVSVGLVTEFLTMRSTTLDLILSHAVSLVTLLPIITPRYLSILVESTMLMGNGCGSMGGLSVHDPRYIRSVLSRLITMPEALQKVCTTSSDTSISCWLFKKKQVSSAYCFSLVGWGAP